MAKVFLIGMMGSGKSVTGQALAGLLKTDFTDLDLEIEKRQGLSIPEIFRKFGEAYFRDLEAGALKALPLEAAQVVATGGGAVLRPENVAFMRRCGTIVYLETSAEVLWTRVRHKKDRPLLASADPRAALEKILAERKAIYEASCNFSVKTDGQTAPGVARQIQQRLKI